MLNKPIFLVALVLVLQQVEAFQTNERIIGGIEANSGQYPYLAAVYVTTREGRFFCGGTVIGNQWIITAAQCVSNALSFTILLGSTHLTREDANRITVATSEHVMYSDYNPDTLEHDVGLIKLRLPIEYSDYIKAALIPVDHIMIGIRYWTAGWGQTSDDKAGLTDSLHWTTVTTLPNEQCKIAYGNQITDHMVCADGNYNEGTCTGDTGGPLYDLLKFGTPLLVGVSSFMSSRGCESTDPSGYTRVFPYTTWITNITGIHQ